MEKESTKPNVNSFLLSRTECNVMRGLAIIPIVLNNFGHCVTGVRPDNEFNYNFDRIIGLFESFSNHNSILPLDLLSFYSPFGVMLFIFLSGYGLVLKYEKGNGHSASNTSFVIDHYKKLFMMQAKGLAFFMLLFFIFESKEVIAIVPFVKQLLLTGNILSHHFITPGPYWFFCMIFEMYIIYRFVFYRCSSNIMMTIVLLSLVVMAFLEPNGKIMTYARMNIGMALLPFCLGIWVARHWQSNWTIFNSKWKCLLYFIISFILLTLSKFNFYTWLLMPVFIVMTSITLVKLFVSNNTTTQLFAWLGGLSGVMFVIHPALREVLIHRANTNGQWFDVILIYLFLTIVLSFMLKPVFTNKQ